MLATKEQIQEYSKILNSEPIQELILWINEQKQANLRGHFERFAKLPQEAAENWAKLLKKKFNLTDFIQESISEKTLQGLFIDQEGYQQKLPFVKREKLFEIVEFPDFSALASENTRIRSIVKEAEMFGFSLDDLINYSKNGFSEELNDRIEQQSFVKIEGWEEIQKFCSIVVYINSLNELRKNINHPMRDMNMFFLRQGFLHDYKDSHKVDLEKLRNQLPGIN
jgi:hypothetical protein